MTVPATPDQVPGARASGTLLLADISGYTGFLQSVADAHVEIIVDAPEPPPAYALVASLLDGIVGRIAPPFRLVKFEGDAVFAVATDAELPYRGDAVLECLRACYVGFHEQLADAHERWTCDCDACVRIHDLDLKFVMHHGEYVVQRVGAQEELLGPAVNHVHRLLKNGAAAVIGSRPYALITDVALDALGIDGAGMAATTETYERVPPIPVHILPLV